MKITVAIGMITYNHEAFIAQAIEGVLMQKTNFNFKLIITDDCSTDKTTIICKQYAEKYPELIDYELLKSNIGAIKNAGYCLKKCINSEAKYIAICEGDDYWTDPLKLQKQVDFLEANPDFNICFTQANTLRGNKLELHPIPNISPNGVYTFDDLLEHYNFITTASVVFRNIFSKIPEWIYQLPYGDMGLYFLVSQNAKIKCLPEITSVYRIHEKGTWSGTNELKKVENQLKFYQVLFNQLNHHQKQLVKNKHKVLIAKISYQLHKKNRLLRVLKRIQLSNKYKL